MKTQLFYAFHFLILTLLLANIQILHAQVDSSFYKSLEKGSYDNAYSIYCTGGYHYAYVTDPQGESPLDLTTEGSVEAWVKISEYVDYAGIAMKPEKKIDSYTLQLGGPGGYGSSKQILFGLNDGNEKKIVSNTHLALNKWYHVIGTWSSTGDSLAIYINGKRDNISKEPLGTILTNDETLNIGKGNYGSLNGNINCVRVWNKAFTLEDAQRVMYETDIPTTHDLYPNLMGAWKFNEGRETTVPDCSAHNNDATLTNSEMWETDGAPLAAVWQGENNDWNDETNWPERLVPNKNIKVIVPPADNNVQISTFEAARNLTVEDNSNLTIKSDADNTGSLFVKERASGEIYVERFIPANYYHYISKPVCDTRTIAAIETIDGKTSMGLNSAIDYNSLFYWDESDDTNNSNGMWVDMLRGHSTSALISGRGYAYSNRTNSLGGGNDITLLFQGKIETNDLSVNCSYNASAGEGFHVLGNPFSATIAISAEASSSNFLDDNAAVLDDYYEAIFLWKENQNETEWGDNYVVICNSGFAGTEPQTQSDFIQLGQAFMIKVDETGGNVVFNADTQIDPEATATPFFKKEKSSWPGVELTVKNEAAESKTRIGFNDRMTAELDPSYDVKSLKANSAINMYTLLAADNSGDFAVQSVPLGQESITCGVDVIESGNYTFSAFQEGLTELFIEDTELNTITDLLAGDTPPIFLSEGSYSSRFILHFKTENNASNSIEANEIGQVYNANSSIYFKNITGTIQIFDISGRLIKQVEINAPLQVVSMENLHGIFVVKTAEGNSKVVL